MTPQDLIAAFDTLAEAPNAGDRLRELVLQLAVRGKLVPQNPEDEPAGTLLNRVFAMRARLVAGGQISKPKPQPAVTDADLQFVLPQGWAACRFEDVHEKLGAGSTPLGGKKAYVDDGFPFLRSQNIWNDGIRIQEVARIPESIHRRMSGTVVRESDVLLNITGASIARAAVVDASLGEANVSQHVAIVRQVDPAMNRWVHLFLISPVGYACIMGVQVGISREGLSMARLREFVLPVPPLAEQRRIVDRVDELMGLLDRLEAARDDRETTRKALRDSALAAFQQADTPEEVEAAWQRIAQNIHDLFTNPADIEPLRQTVLQLAVRGHLVPQDPNDDPADEWLEQVDSERALLVAQKVARKRRPPSPVTDRDGLPSLPDGWRWGRLGNVLLDIEAGWSPSAERRPKDNDEWGVLKVSSCSWGRFLPEENKALRPGTEPRVELEVRQGDFLISRANTRELVARSVVVKDCPPRLMLSDKTLRLHVASAVCAEYVNLANLSQAARAHFEAKASGTSASMRNVSQDVIWNAPIPIPPKQEQHRIVARFDELVELTDCLEQNLGNQRGHHDAFAAAAVHHLDA